MIRVTLMSVNDKFEITDDTRMKATIPTIKKILKDGGKRYPNESSWQAKRRAGRKIFIKTSGKTFK